MRRFLWNAAILCALLVALCAASFVTSAPVTAAPAQPDNTHTRTYRHIFGCQARAVHLVEQTAKNNARQQCQDQLDRQSFEKGQEYLNRSDIVELVSVACAQDPQGMDISWYRDRDTLFTVAFARGTQTCLYAVVQRGSGGGP